MNIFTVSTPDITWVCTSFSLPITMASIGTVIAKNFVNIGDRKPCRGREEPNIYPTRWTGLA